MTTWTDAETARVENIEEFLNELASQVEGLASKKQFAQSALLNETQITDLTTRVATLESQMATLINRFNLGR